MGWIKELIHLWITEHLFLLQARNNNKNYDCGKEFVKIYLLLVFLVCQTENMIFTI